MADVNRGGSKAARLCPFCGSVVTARARRCRQCGASLGPGSLPLVLPGCQKPAVLAPSEPRRMEILLDLPCRDGSGGDPAPDVQAGLLADPVSQGTAKERTGEANTSARESGEPTETADAPNPVPLFSTEEGRASLTGSLLQETAGADKGRDSICRVCGAANQAAARFCRSCGTPLDPAPVCQACGADLRLGAGYCWKCGVPLAQSAPALVPKLAPVADPGEDPKASRRRTEPETPASPPLEIVFPPDSGATLPPQPAAPAEKQGSPAAGRRAARRPGRQSSSNRHRQWGCCGFWGALILLGGLALMLAQCMGLLS